MTPIVVLGIQELRRQYEDSYCAWLFSLSVLLRVKYDHFFLAHSATNDL